MMTYRNLIPGPYWLDTGHAHTTKEDFASIASVVKRRIIAWNIAISGLGDLLTSWDGMHPKLQEPLLLRTLALCLWSRFCLASTIRTLV